jgi:hypothetical protein
MEGRRTVLAVKSSTTALDLPLYVHDGLLHQCPHCRCFQRRDDPRRWDAVPQLELETAVLITHRLCRPCAWKFYAVN